MIQAIPNGVPQVLAQFRLDLFPGLSCWRQPGENGAAAASQLHAVGMQIDFSVAILKWALPESTPKCSYRQTCKFN